MLTSDKKFQHLAVSIHGCEDPGRRRQQQQQQQRLPLPLPLTAAPVYLPVGSSLSQPSTST